jgi:hypothetical protein
MLHSLKFETARLIQATVEEVATQIRSSLPKITKGLYISYLNSLEQTITDRNWNRFRPFNPETGCLVTNLSRLPADRLDFGAGTPRLALPLTVEKNSAGILRNDENYVLRIVY